jgi:hypothetical protein
MWDPSPTPDLPWHYEVIGEHLTDPTRLLVIDDDERLYALSLVDGHTEPARLLDTWLVDSGELREKFQRPQCIPAARKSQSMDGGTGFR